LPGNWWKRWWLSHSFHHGKMPIYTGIRMPAIFSKTSPHAN
jgi:hypothetical protein